MTGVIAALVSGRAIRPITATNWGTNNGASPQTSAARALTVPAGNPGNIRLDLSASATFQYSKNGGAFTTFTDGQPLTVANGDTLAFKATGAAFDGGTVTVVDTGAPGSPTVGTWLTLLS